mmetsp:Transcript_3293/g.8232  ORF Transcript_3293/g.8232 Transcript_3293/m.8232 type:complete len:365 (+) Transcript_3293:241-1335(+)
MARLGESKAVLTALSLAALLFVGLHVSPRHPINARVRSFRLQKHLLLPARAHAVPPAAALPDSAVPTATSQPSGLCSNASTYLANTEFWGGVVSWGDQNIVGSAEECCRSCAEYQPTIEMQAGRPCTTFIYNPETKSCWLKNTREEHLSKPGRGPNVPWTSGVNTGPYRACEDCTIPSQFYGCIGKATCNTTRHCGSPAIDGYANVVPSCLDNSTEAQVYLSLLREGVRLEAHAEEGADFDGLGVRWGIGHKKANWSECEAACIAHKPTPAGGPFSKLPCNVWTWCGRERCWEPDAHSHSFGDCWLKFTEQPESPEVNMRIPMSKPYMRRHARDIESGVPWVSGVLLAPGKTLTNGTWGPRAFW